MNDQAVGYVCVLVACLAFGSNYLPAKTVRIYDGQFFNVCLASGILTVGVIQWALSGFYKLEPFAAIGGVIWGLGNLAVPFILARCGLGPGQLTWGLAQILTGWATGKFGLFGKEKDVVATPWMNYMGVGLLMVSLSLFSLMKPGDSGARQASGLSLQPVDGQQGDAEVPTVHSIETPLWAAGASAVLSPPTTPVTGSGGFFAGFIAAILTGILFGSNFDPPTYLKQEGEADIQAGRPPRHSPNDTDYVVSHYCGIFLVTLLGFLVYRSFASQTFVGRQVVCPGFVAGLMWGIAGAAWFKANGVLPYVISFPIIVGVPGVIAALWGCLLFGENRGCRNGALLCTVAFVQCAAVLLIALSKGG